MTEWISVKDRLPKTGTVLATDGQIVITAPSSSVTADGQAITHWMPLPRYGNVIVKMSNNVAKNSSGDSLVMLRTPKAIAFANPMTHTEAYRPEKKFSDAVKGFVLYESKIVRPKELIVMNVKK